MLIQHGAEMEKLFGLRLKVSSPSFHKTFGAIETLPADFNLDIGLTNFNQNMPNSVFGTPAQPEGCMGMTDADIATDADHIIYSPWFSYTKACYLANVPVGSALDVTDGLNSPTVYGLQALGETTDVQALAHRKTSYKVTPINNSLFQGVISAMHVGKGSISFAANWYESFDSPLNGILPVPSGRTSGHNWKICGLKTINGVPYLITKPWLGQAWGSGGFCYISEQIFNSLNGLAFSFAKASINDIQVRYVVVGTLLDFLKRLLALTGGTQVLTVFQIMQQELAIIQEEINLLTHKPMNTLPPNPDVGPLDWTTQKGAYHATRVKADLAGMTLDQKNTLCGCIYQESEFLNYKVPGVPTKFENLDKTGRLWSTDWGICQINDWFHIAPHGTDFPSVDYVMANPDKAIEWMIHQFLAGNAHLWSSYVSGAYKQHLLPGSPMWALAS